MRKIILAAVASLGAIAATSSAFAQDSGSSSRSIEPYVGVSAVYDSFDSKQNGSETPAFGPDGWLAEAVAGVNVPLGDKFFVGVEGNVAKGVDGDMDWEYGAAGRAGLHLADMGLLYGKVGYNWVELDNAPVGVDRSFDGVVWGAGFELGPRAGKIRVRGEVTTMKNFESIRPSLGAVMAF
jgi:outer membrane immunogenic protein